MRLELKTPFARTPEKGLKISLIRYQTLTSLMGNLTGIKNFIYFYKTIIKYFIKKNEIY